MGNVVSDGIKEAQERVREKLKTMKLKEKEPCNFSVALNYQANGFQYMSCVSFKVQKADNGDIIVGYQMFGKKLIEEENQRSYRQRLENYLTAVADERLAATFP